jgi:hypothetical protein
MPRETSAIISHDFPIHFSFSKFPALRTMLNTIDWDPILQRNIVSPSSPTEGDFSSEVEKLVHMMIAMDIAS